MNATAGIGMTSARTRERLIERLRGEGITDPRVLEAIRSVPRHLFVDEALSSRAYEDTALPIGHGQTISQPFIVARMTQAVIAEGIPQKLLEIGTGCGYQAAVLSRLVRAVYSIERIRPLMGRARKLLLEQRIRNVNLRYGDGTAGWPEAAPFDAIVVTAAPEYVPESLLEQLAPQGRLIAPVGPRSVQQLTMYRRMEGGVETQVLGAVSFVPFTSGTSQG